MKTSDIIPRYLESLDGHLAPGTLLIRRRVLNHLMGFLDQRGIANAEDLRFAHLAEWNDGRQLKDSTRNNELSHMQKFLRWLEQREYITRHLDIADLRARCSSPEPEALPDDLVRSIMANDDWLPIYHVAAGLYFLLGLRRSEALSLVRWSWREDDRLLTVPESQRERNKRHGRTLPVGPHLAGCLQNYLDTIGPLSPNAPILSLASHRAGRMFRRWADRQQKPLTPQRARIWFCGTLQRNECPHYLAEKMMGHKLQGAAHHYTPYDPEQARKWVEIVEHVAIGTP